MKHIARPAPLASLFKPKMKLNTKLISDYSKDYPKEFWEDFPRNIVSSWDPVSYMSATAWRELASELRYPAMSNIDWIVDGISQGFRIGCRGTGRWPMTTPNHKTAVVYGPQLVDTMATWMVKCLAAGPYEPHELPWPTDVIKQSPISVALKPTGAGRICVDMSYPHIRKDEVDVDHGTVITSVNSGIEGELFPTWMATFASALMAINAWGPGCKMCKVNCNNQHKLLSSRSNLSSGGLERCLHAPPSSPN